MSADNWTQCPRCARQKKAMLDGLDQQLREQYGRIPVEDFDRERAEIDRLRTEAADAAPLFREDYEIYGVAEGTLHIRYSGRCFFCALTHEFSVDQPLDLDGADRG